MQIANIYGVLQVDDQIPSSIPDVVVVQSFSPVQLSMILWAAALQVSLSFTISWSLLKLMSTESVMLSVIPFSSCPQSFLASGVFPIELALHIRWPKYWSLSYSISPSNEHSGLISFRIDWLDLLAVQGTLQSLFQHHSSKARDHGRSGTGSKPRIQEVVQVGPELFLPEATLLPTVLDDLWGLGFQGLH